jgi:hypothetical protein
VIAYTSTGSTTRFILPNNGGRESKSAAFEQKGGFENASNVLSFFLFGRAFFMAEENTL